MKKLNQYLEIAILIVCSLTFLNTCSVKSVQRKVNTLSNKVDSLNTVVIKKDQMIKLLQETPAWKTLRIEEISDKENISINALEEKSNK
jgi:hypothetical protein